jgi:hypothetical protein
VADREEAASADACEMVVWARFDPSALARPRMVLSRPSELAGGRPLADCVLHALAAVENAAR